MVLTGTWEVFKKTEERLVGRDHRLVWIRQGTVMPMPMECTEEQFAVLRLGDLMEMTGTVKGVSDG